ncbi:hypothetical protein [Sorangium sp. So ce726]|uniref:hypothetical protein n=1 Tax=Sorangium sp. So ce726 TaxID=3133319 RepID=UPI003F60A4A6
MRIVTRFDDPGMWMFRSSGELPICAPTKVTSGWRSITRLRSSKRARASESATSSRTSSSG